jgi:3-hydroxymyristoyl/3-hydroxydecanoyl-(acyl carrier protein) dehydratase
MSEIPLAIARDHPSYRGHFPGRPLLPGVVLLAEVMAAVEGGPWNVSQAKFVGVVEPGDALMMTAQAQASGVRFEVHSPRGPVASGVLVPRP